MREGELASIENRVAPLSEIFRLQGADELKQAETRFLPQTAPTARAIILAASRGATLGELTLDRPKTMVEIEGEPILAHIVRAYGQAEVRDITVVRGYCKETVALPGLKTVDNDDFESTGELHSLQLALQQLDETRTGDLFISYGDVLFHRRVLDLLIAADGDFIIPVDTNWQESHNLRRHVDFVATSAPPSRHSFKQTIELRYVASDVSEDERQGEWMGFLRVAERGIPILRETVDQILEEVSGREADLGMLLNWLAQHEKHVRVVYTIGSWLDIDDLHDVVNAGSFQ
jgi:phosphoenolpyruvate phosphomutase